MIKEFARMIRRKLTNIQTPSARIFLARLRVEGRLLRVYDKVNDYEIDQDLADRMFIRCLRALRRIETIEENIG